MLHHADANTAQQVDDQYQNTRNGIASNKLRGTVHRTVEVSLLRNFAAAVARLILIDQTGIEVGINRHLLAGHCVQCKARAYFRNTPRTLRDYNEVNDDKNQKDNDTNNVVTTNDNLTEGLNYLTGGIATLVPVQQHNTGRRDVERQPEQRCTEQDGRKHREI